MKLVRRTGVAMLASAVLALGLTSGALASGGSGGGSGGGGGGGGTGGGGGSSAALCGSVALNATQLITSYYSILSGSITNCGSTATSYSLDVLDTSVHANPACLAFSIVASRPATLAPGTIPFSRAMSALPCYDTYTLQVQLTENHQVVASASLILDKTPLGVFIR